MHSVGTSSHQIESSRHIEDRGGADGPPVRSQIRGSTGKLFLSKSNYSLRICLGRFAPEGITVDRLPMVVDEYETLRARSLANFLIADSATDDQARQLKASSTTTK